MRDSGHLSVGGEMSTFTLVLPVSCVPMSFDRMGRRGVGGFFFGEFSSSFSFTNLFQPFLDVIESFQPPPLSFANAEWCPETTTKSLHANRGKHDSDMGMHPRH